MTLDTQTGLHPWLRKLRVAFLPGPTTPVEAQAIVGIQASFARHGHIVQAAPDDTTDLLYACAPFGQPVSWRDAPFLQARRVFRLQRQPTVVSILSVRPGPWRSLLAELEHAIAKEPPDPEDFRYPGLAPSAVHTLVEQGRRGGPVLAAQRMLQAQAVCVRLLLLVGEDQPERAYHFDLVGSLACSDGAAPDFYDDIVLRTVTAASADEIGAYTVAPEPITALRWAALTTPLAMRHASLELGQRNFFTDPVVIADLVYVPALSGAVANQYSEGCFATWDPTLDALIATITGSARPVDKGNITDDELAVITGLQEDRAGVLMRRVEGKRNDPPSSEAFEMVEIDNVLPRITPAGLGKPVPVVRSKLHGHRGVAAYNPERIEFAPMDAAYSRFPVTCGTRGQAEGVRTAFARAETLLNPEDPRKLVFTLLPTHGLFVLEKWTEGKAPFQLIWEAMDAGDLRIEASVPQGPAPYAPPQIVR